MDGLEELKGVFVMGATNRADLIDPAMLRPGRFDDIIELGLPDEDARRQILAVHLRNKPLATNICAEDLAARCHDASGAELAAVCNRAALAALRRAVQQSKEAVLSQSTGDEEPVKLTVRIEQHDFDEVIAEMFGDKGNNSDH
jgi:transitional endoplasmic reticulum ATPase